jgi:putative N-acetyltransferase (TIGR04045 family)
MGTRLAQPTSIRLAESGADVGEHLRIRHAVFVVEQGMFPVSDMDAHDSAPDVLRVLGRYEGVPAGAVRLYPLDRATRLWQGDRLAVLPEYRAHDIGGPLVRYAVATAASRGGSMMVAHIQLPNVRFFERLGWSRAGDVEIYCGRAHLPMHITLP